MLSLTLTVLDCDRHMACAVCSATTPRGSMSYAECAVWCAVCNATIMVAEPAWHLQEEVPEAPWSATQSQIAGD